MPRRAAERPAAYARTRHLEQFLDLVTQSVPARVDAEYGERRMGLRGGDVRAFLQSLRVLGLVDAWGHPTERLRQARARERRPQALRDALSHAYPELVERCEREGGLSREAVEDHFKLVYGLGATSAGPAAKLFLDLWNGAGAGNAVSRVREASSKGGEAASAVAEPDAAPETSAPDRENRYGRVGRAGEENGGRAGERVRMLADLIHIDIGPDWEVERINLVFDRLERLLDRLEG